MKDIKDIRDDQIRILGTEETPPRGRFKYWWFIIIVIVALLIYVVLSMPMYAPMKESSQSEWTSEISAHHMQAPEEGMSEQEFVVADSLEGGYTEVRDTIINDIPLKIYVPHNAVASLQLGKLNTEDSDIVLVAQAADIRADNGKIVGAFVMKGTPLAWGLSKKGYCAIIHDSISLGMADNSPLFEEATETGGYFFRQSALVSDGALVENNPKGKSIRRGICERNGVIFVVETRTSESFHDFSQALVDLGVNQAVYLVGSSAYGWAVTQNGERHEFGLAYDSTDEFQVPENTSYIVWRKKK